MDRFGAEDWDSVVSDTRVTVRINVRSKVVSDARARVRIRVRNKVVSDARASLCHHYLW